MASVSRLPHVSIKNYSWTPLSTDIDRSLGGWGVGGVGGGRYISSRNTQIDLCVPELTVV